MSAEKHTDWLLDHLYSDDQSEEVTDSEESRHNLTPAQKAELLELQQFLGELREHMPLAEPRASTRANLLVAAQSELTTQSEQEAATSTRKPQAPRAGNDSLWSRHKFHAFAQISGVAALLIAGVFGLAQFQSNNEPAQESASITMAKNEAKPAASLDKKLAMAPAKSDAADFPEKKDIKQTQDNLKPEADANKTLAMNTGTKTDEGKGLGSSDPKVEKEPAFDKKKPRYKSKKSSAIAVKPKAQSKDSIYGSLNSRTNRAGLDKSAKKSAIPSIASGRSFNSPEAPSRMAVKNKANDDAKYDVRVESTKETTNKKVARKTAPTKKADAIADLNTTTKNAPASEKKVAATPTLAGVERSFKSDKFDDTLTQANNYLRTGKGTSRQRARALELKAKAYEKLGRSDEANRLYDQIRKKHPTYFKKKALKYPKKRSKRKSKSSIDMMESF